MKLEIVGDAEVEKALNEQQMFFKRRRVEENINELP